MVLLDSKKRLETFLVKLLWAAFFSISKPRFLSEA